MRRSAAPSVLAKKLQEQGKENAADAKSNVCDKAGRIEPRRNFLSSRKKFKTPVASVGLVDPSAPRSHSEEDVESVGIEGFAQRNDSNVEENAPFAVRKPLQVLNLINLGRVGTAGNNSTAVSSNGGNHSPQSASSLSPSIPDFIPDRLGMSACNEENLDLPSVANLESIPGRSLLSKTPTVGVKRSCPDDGRLKNGNLDIMRKRYHQVKKQREPLLDGEVVRFEEVPAISNVEIVSGECSTEESKHLNMNQIRSDGTDRADLNVRLESTSSGGKREQYVYVKEEHDNKVVPLDSKVTEAGNTSHSPRHNQSSLHCLKEASRPTQEAVLADFYLVMYCPRKKNAKRKGPWSDGIIVCQGRSCTLQDMDGKAITKANVQGLKDMPEGATVEVSHRLFGLHFRARVILHFLHWFNEVLACFTFLPVVHLCSVSFSLLDYINDALALFCN